MGSATAASVTETLLMRSVVLIRIDFPTSTRRGAEPGDSCEAACVVASGPLAAGGSWAVAGGGAAGEAACCGAAASPERLSMLTANISPLQDCIFRFSHLRECIAMFSTLEPALM